MVDLSFVKFEDFATIMKFLDFIVINCLILFMVFEISVFIIKKRHLLSPLIILIAVTLMFPFNFNNHLVPINLFPEHLNNFIHHVNFYKNSF